MDQISDFLLSARIGSPVQQSVTGAFALGRNLTEVEGKSWQQDEVPMPQPSAWELLNRLAPTIRQYPAKRGHPLQI